MTDVDISPEAVEAVCASLQRYLDSLGAKGMPSVEIDTLRALSAALTQSRAETAAAYAVATHGLDKWATNLRDMNFPDTAPIVEQCSAMIRALTTPDQTAALDAAVVKAGADGMREAAGIVARHAETARKALGNALDPLEANDWGLIVMRCDLIRDAILAATPKGGAE